MILGDAVLKQWKDFHDQNQTKQFVKNEQV